jgi:hypothetical protein
MEVRGSDGEGTLTWALGRVRSNANTVPNPKANWVTRGTAYPHPAVASITLPYRVKGRQLSQVRARLHDVLVYSPQPSIQSCWLGSGVSGRFVCTY